MEPRRSLEPWTPQGLLSNLEEKYKCYNNFREKHNFCNFLMKSCPGYTKSNRIWPETTKWNLEGPWSPGRPRDFKQFRREMQILHNFGEKHNFCNFLMKSCPGYTKSNRIWPETIKWSLEGPWSPGRPRDFSSLEEKYNFYTILEKNTIFAIF